MKGRRLSPQICVIYTILKDIASNIIYKIHLNTCRHTYLQYVLESAVQAVNSAKWNNEETTTDITLCDRQMWRCIAVPPVSFRSSPLRQIYLTANEGSTGRHKVLRCVPRTAHYEALILLRMKDFSFTFSFRSFVALKDGWHFSREDCGNIRLGKKTVFLAVLN
jgi:hypothetical protein